MSTKTRVLCDSNLTPVMFDNPRWVDDGKASEPDAQGHPRFIRNYDCHDYLVSLGAEETFMIYKGTLNNAPMWIGKTGEQVSWGRNFDYSLQGNHSDPINNSMLYEVAKLASKPETYKATALPHCPIILDIEGAPTMNVAPDDSLADRIYCVMRWLEAVKYIKQAAGADQEVWIYGHYPDLAKINPEKNLALGGLLTQLAQETTAACGFLYFWDWDVDNSNHWIAELERIDASILRNAPWYVRAKVLAINPFDQIYAPQNDRPSTATMNGKPSHLPTWKNLVDEAVERGFALYVWTGDGILDGVQEHLKYAASKGYNAA